MADPLFDAIIAPAALAAGWRQVRRNGGAPGGDGVTLAAFARRLAPSLAGLHRRLAAGRYRPGPLARLSLPKPSGGTRPLAIPCVADRVVQSAAAAALAARLDPEMAPASFAYRPGRSVEHALGLVLTYRLWGYRWAVDGDIADFFDSVPHDRLTARLAASVASPRTLALVGLWLKGFSPAGRGLPQGSPISPLLANLYLTPFDRAADGRRTRLVRYADDFLVLCRSRAEAERARQRLARLLAAEGLRLNPAKTRIRSLDAGIDFLGYRLTGTAVAPAGDRRAPPGPTA